MKAPSIQVQSTVQLSEPLQKEGQFSKEEAVRFVFGLWCNTLFSGLLAYFEFGNDKNHVVSSFFLVSSALALLIFFTFLTKLASWRFISFSWAFLLCISAVGPIAKLQTSHDSDLKEVLPRIMGLGLVMLNNKFALKLPFAKQTICASIAAMTEISTFVSSLFWFHGIDHFEFGLFFFFFFIANEFEIIMAFQKLNGRRSNICSLEDQFIGEFPSGIFNGAKFECANAKLRQLVTEIYPEADSCRESAMFFNNNEILNRFLKETLLYNIDREAEVCNEVVTLENALLIALPKQHFSRLSYLGECEVAGHTFQVLSKREGSNKMLLLFIRVRNIERLKVALTEEKTKKTKLSKMIHEFKTPLSLVCNMCDEVFSNFPEVNLSIVKSLRYLSTYTANLAFSLQKYVKMFAERKMSSRDWFGGSNISVTKIRLYELMEFLKEVLEIMTKSKRRNVETSCNILNMPINFAICTDKHLLLQIFFNLISNAVKFTFEGSISIDSEYLIEGTEEVLRIAVKDTGPGISTEDQHKIFSDYCEIVDSPSNPTGSGLGLSISKEIAKILGFKLSFTSKEGEGSSFILDIPYKNKDRNMNNFEHYNKRKSTVPLKKPINMQSNGNIQHFKTFKEGETKNLSPKLRNFNKMSSKENINLGHLENSFEMSDDQFNSDDDSVSNSLSDVTERREFVPINIREVLNNSFSSCTKRIANSGCSSKFANSKDSRVSTIAIIDDEYNMKCNLKNVVKRSFERKGKTCIFKCGSDGIDLLKIVYDSVKEGKQIDLVLLDINMTYLKGNEAVKLLERMGLTVPELCYTSEKTGEDFLPKPCPEEYMTRLLVQRKILV